MAKKTRVFAIGDDERGLTIVITQPPTVLHYSIEELQPTPKGGLATKNPTQLSPRQAMATFIKEFVLLRRGNDVDTFYGSPDRYDPTEHEIENDNAAAIARNIANGGNHYEVDFCLAFDVPDDLAERRMRSTEPTKTVSQTLQGKAPSASDVPVMNIAKDPSNDDAVHENSPPKLKISAP
jgi:hypothetical protein